MVLGIETGTQEAAGREGEILAVLAPRVAVNDGKSKNLFATVGREKGIKGLRRLDFAVRCDLGLFGLFLLGGAFFGEFGGGKGFWKRRSARKCFVALGPLRAAWPSLIPFKRRSIS